MNSNLYELRQFFNDGLEMFDTGIKCIVRALTAGDARRIAAEDDGDTFWMHSDTVIEQIGWATGEKHDSIVAVTR